MLRLVLNSADLFCHSACKNEGWDNLKGCHSNPVFRGPRGGPVGLADIRLDTEVQQREVRCPRAVARTAGVHPPSPLSRLCRRINLQHQGAKNSPESSLNAARSHWLQKWSFTSPRPIFRNVQTPADVSSRCCLSARVPVRFPPSPIPHFPHPRHTFKLNYRREDGKPCNYALGVPQVCVSWGHERSVGRRRPCSQSSCVENSPWGISTNVLTADWRVNTLKSWL